MIMNKLIKYFSLQNFIFFIYFSFLYFPILVLIVYSFNQSSLMMVWSKFSLHWYIVLFKDIILMRALFFSLFIATLSATISSMISVILSLAMLKIKNFWGSRFLNITFRTMLAVPDVINGLSLLLLFVTINNFTHWTSNGVVNICLSHIALCTSYTFVIINNYLKNKNFLIEKAATNLGANSLKVFFFITLPILSPAIFVSWLVSFTISLDDLIISSFVTRPGVTTLPIQIFAMVRRGVNPEINALSSILLLVVIIIIFFIWKIVFKQEQSNKLI